MKAIDQQGQRIDVGDVLTLDGSDLYEVIDVHVYDDIPFVEGLCIRPSQHRRKPVAFGEGLVAPASQFSARPLNPASWARQRRQDRMDLLKAYVGWAASVAAAVGLLVALYRLP